MFFITCTTRRGVSGQSLFLARNRFSRLNELLSIASGGSPMAPMLQSVGYEKTFEIHSFFRTQNFA